MGRKYVAHPYYSGELGRLLGCRPYPGTLNLETDSDWRMLASLCLPTLVREAVWDGVRLGAVYVWRVEELAPLRAPAPPSLLIRPLLSRHPPNVLELVSCSELRPLLASEVVEVTVACERNPFYTRAPRLPPLNAGD